MRYRPSLWAGAGVAVLYWALGQASLIISVSHGIVTPVLFLPEGVALAAALLFGPGIAVGVLAGQWGLALAWGQPWWLALGVALVNTGEVLIACHLGARMRIGPGLNVRSYARLMLLIFIVLQPYSATLGTILLGLSGQLADARAWSESWVHWWMGNAFAQALLAPLVLVDPPPFTLQCLRRLRKVSLPLAGLAITLVLTCLGRLPWQGPAGMLLLVECLLLWIAVRAGAACACLCVVGVVIAILAGTGVGRSPFQLDGIDQVYEFNALLLGLAIATQVLALAESDRRAAEASLVQSRDEAESARRHAEEARSTAEQASAAKSRFLASVSHELRTPLNAILGFSELMLLDDAVGEKQRGQLRHIQRAGKHLLSLIEEALDLSQIAAGRMTVRQESVALAGLAAECCSMLSPLADAKGVRVTVGVDASLRAMADPARLRQVLINLLSNAVKYNREAGRVWLHAYRTGAGQLRLTVRDNGIGIAASYQSTIFQPFDRGAAHNGPTEGAGIGLAISRELVTLMGGTLGLKSELGRGSLFWFDLPESYAAATRTPSAPGTVAEPPVAEPGDPRPVVLCVADDVDHLALIQEVLRAQPELRVFGVRSAQDAFDLADRVRPHLVVIDLDMVDMADFGVLDMLRGHPELMAALVVAVSSYASGTWMQGRAKGVLRTFQKPLDVGEFRQEVVRLVVSTMSIV